MCWSQVREGSREAPWLFSSSAAGLSPAGLTCSHCAPCAGGVVSGLGKGITASSIGVLLKACGHRVTSIKIGRLAARAWHAERHPIGALGMHATGAAATPLSAVGGSRVSAAWPKRHSNQLFCLIICWISAMQTPTSMWTPAPCPPLSTARCLFWTTAERCGVGGGAEGPSERSAANGETLRPLQPTAWHPPLPSPPGAGHL